MKLTKSQIKSRILSLRFSPALCFVILVAFLGVVSIVYNLVNPEVRFFEIYFYNPYDSFMDFYHPIIFSTAENPYAFELVGAIYPPLCYLIFGFLSKFVPQSALGDAHTLRNEQNARMLFMLCVFICVLFILYSISKKLKCESWKKNIILLSILISFPMLYLLERGNILLLVIALLIFFVLNHDSENKILSELSLIALAVAASIKIYPAVFGLILLFEDKVDFKKIMRCALYGILLFFLPFFCYGGISAFKEFLENLAAGVADTPLSEIAPEIRVDFSTMIYEWSDMTMSAEAVEALASPLSKIFAVVLVIGVFTLKDKWKKLLCLSVITMIIPAFLFTYCLMMFLPALVFLLAEKEIKIYDVIYLVFFALVFTLSPLNSNKSLLHIISVLYVILVIDIIISLIPYALRLWAYIKAKRQAPREDAE